jgi:hypothetical protein
MFLSKKPDFKPVLWWTNGRIIYFFQFMLGEDDLKCGLNCQFDKEKQKCEIKKTPQYPK